MTSIDKIQSSYRKLVNVIKEKTVYFLDIEGYKKVRTDLGLVISSTYPSVEDMLDENSHELKKEAVVAGKRAEEINPHRNVFAGIDAVKELKSRLLVLFFFSFLFSSIGIMGAKYMESLLLFVLTNILSIPLVLVAGVTVYLELLKLDTWVSRRINKELTFSSEEVDEMTDKRNRFTCRTWNSLLNKNHAIPTIASLRIMLIIFPRTYRKCIRESVLMAPEGINQHEENKGIIKYISDIYTEIKQFRNR